MPRKPITEKGQKGRVLRYIAGGIVVILIGVLVAVLLVNCRREDQGVRYD